ncbi:hypothetical protein [Neisseria polysaccharea]|uniref:hypothetical protein n=1 Tax=Neisseria polysaccharea TaxID=489 RepID=UPI0001D9DB0B|nr:hypothetical protein [Neisseria polysaccharea]EFH23064.1 hypothetical protein NEIPOLOT_01162 [Neisseria polysaccharea ATCC 43768]
MNKNILYIFSLLIAIVIFFIFEKNVIRKISFDYNKKEFLISDITNFNWDYVKLYIINSDFQKIVFYYKGKIVFEELIELDREGNVLPQYLFDSDLENIEYYECDYKNGKMQLLKKEKSHFSDEYFYYYKPINCRPKLL